MSRTFICARCGGRYDSDVSEAEALAEYQAEFPGHEREPDPANVLCETCWQRFQIWRQEVDR